MIARGEAAEAIPCAAAALHTDLIVMHSRRQSYAATLLGSTAEMISRAAPCPVLITHSYKQDWVSAETGEIRLKNILMAYDFSNDAELALVWRYFSPSNIRPRCICCTSSRPAVKLPKVPVMNVNSSRWNYNSPFLRRRNLGAK